MSRSLVIGGTLFIGRALVEQLLDRGDDVAIMHRGRGTPYGARVREIRCDRTDVAAVREALRGERFDFVFDNVYDWQHGTSADQVSAAAIAASEGLGRYVFTSSVAVYPPGGPYDEDAPLLPADHRNRYGAQKAASERALFALHRERGIPVTTVRPAFIYGPDNPFDRESFFWDRIVAGRPIIIPDDGSRTMQFVHVRDVARAALLATASDVAAGRAYNLASAPVTQIELVELLAAAAGRRAELVPIPRETLERAGGDAFGGQLYYGAYLDIPPITVRGDRVRGELGLTLTPLGEGLRDTFTWYERQPRPGVDFSWEDRLLAQARRGVR